MRTENLFDAHAHFSFAPDVEAFASWATARFAGAFSTTVSPQDYRIAREALAGFPSIKVGVGAHPWWVSQGKISEADAIQVAHYAAQERFIGEVGLDFGRNGLARSVFTSEEETKAGQVRVLRVIFAACQNENAVDACEDASNCGRVFSFHAVRAADVILDMLEEYELLRYSTAIFHWFSGSNAQLQRARELGCSFSVNAFMLQTKRGRAYAKAIPADRLLVETDLPEDPEEPYELAEPVASEDFTNRSEGEAVSRTQEAYEKQLVSGYEILKDLRGEEILPIIENNVQRLFG